MDLSTWRPHGLIRVPPLELLYLSAQVSVDNRGDTPEPQEFMTRRLFNQILTKDIFSGDHYAIFPLITPYSDTRKTCDLVVEYCTFEGTSQFLCVVFAKQARDSEISLISALETQALGYCTDYLEENPAFNLIYACTAMGPYVRCWMVLREDGQISMTGLWEGKHRNTFRHYLDIGVDENRSTLEQAFDQMKEFALARSSTS